MHMKIALKVRYWALSDQAQGQCSPLFSIFTAIQTVGSYNSTMVQASKLIYIKHMYSCDKSTQNL